MIQVTTEDMSYDERRIYVNAVIKKGDIVANVAENKYPPNSWGKKPVNQ